MVVDNSYVVDLRRKLDSYSTLYGTPDPKRSKNTSYRRYVGHVREANRRFNDSVRESLRDYEFPQIVLIITGSNGRLEGDPSSPVEYILVGSLPNVESIPHLEVKDVGRCCVAYYRDDPTRVFPGRVLDGVPAGGDEQYLLRAKGKLLEEMRDPRIRRKVAEKRKEYRQIMQTGSQRFKGRPITHFDLENGCAYYGNGRTEGDNGAPASFKYGPLRFVQSRVLEQVFELIERGCEDAVLKMPTNTSERLRWLHDSGLLKMSATDLETVLDAYEYFLWLYHISQHRYRRGKDKTDFDPEDVRYQTNRLLELLGKS